MNTKGIKFLAVLAVLAMAFAAFAVIAPAEENDAVDSDALELSAVPVDAIELTSTVDWTEGDNFIAKTDVEVSAPEAAKNLFIKTGVTVTIKGAATVGALTIAAVNDEFYQLVGNNDHTENDSSLTVATTTTTTDKIAVKATFGGIPTPSVVKGTASSFTVSGIAASVAFDDCGIAGVKGNTCKVPANLDLTVNGVDVPTVGGAYFADNSANKTTIFGTQPTAITLDASDKFYPTNTGVTIQVGTDTVQLASVAAGDFTAGLIFGNNGGVFELQSIGAPVANNYDIKVIYGSLKNATGGNLVTNEAKAISGVVNTDGMTVNNTSIVKAEIAGAYQYVIGNYQPINKSTKIIQDFKVVAGSIFTVPDKYTLTYGQNKYDGEMGANITITVAGILDVWGKVTGVSGKDTDVPSDVIPKIAIVDSENAHMYIRAGTQVSGFVDAAGVSTIVELDGANGSIEELPAATDYSTTSGTVDNDLTYTNVAIVKNGKLTIAEGKTLTITGMLALNGGYILVEGTLVIADGAQIGGTEAAPDATHNAIILGENGKIINNGTIAKYNKVLIGFTATNSVTIQGISGLTIGVAKVGTSYYTGVSGSVDKMTGSNISTITANGVRFSGDITVPTGMTLTLGSKSILAGKTMTVEGALDVGEGGLVAAAGSVIDVQGYMVGAGGIKAQVTTLAEPLKKDDKIGNAETVIVSTTGIAKKDDLTSTHNATGYKILVIKTSYIADDEDMTEMYYQRAYIEGDLALTPAVATGYSFAVGGAVAPTFTVSGNPIFVDELSVFKQTTDNINLALDDAALIVEGVVVSKTDLAALATGATYSIKSDDTTTYYAVDINTGLANIDTYKDQTVKINGIANYEVELLMDITILDKQIVDYGVAASLVIPVGVTLTVNKGGDFDADVIAAIEGKLVVMKDGACDPSPLLYQVYSENDAGDFTYCGFETALEEAVAGDTITLTGAYGVGEGKEKYSLTVPAGVKVIVDNGAVLYIQKTIIVAATAELEVNGTLKFGKELAADADKTKNAKITVNGLMDISGASAAQFNNVAAADREKYGMQIASDGTFKFRTSQVFDGATLVGATYIDGTNTILTTVEQAIEADASKITIPGEYSSDSKIDLGDSELIVLGKAKIAEISVKGGTITATDGAAKLTTTINGVSDEDTPVALALSEFNGKIENKAVSDNYTVAIIDMTGGSVNVKDGVVVMKDANPVVAANQSFAVAEGGVLEIADAGITMALAGTLNVAGTIYVDKDARFEFNNDVNAVAKIANAIIEPQGTLVTDAVTISGIVLLDGELQNEGVMILTGQIYIDESDDTVAVLDVDANIFIGNSTVTGAGAGIFGSKVKADLDNEKFIAVYSDGTVDDKVVEDMKKSVFTLNGAPYVTAYAEGAAVVAIGAAGVISKVVNVPGYNMASMYPAAGDKFANWKDQNGEAIVAGTNVIGTEEFRYVGVQLTAQVVVSTVKGVSVFVDGVSYASGTTIDAVSVGTHTVTASVDPGYKGTTSIAFNGKAITSSFEITPEMVGPTAKYTLTVTGDIVVDPGVAPEPTPEQKDAFGITEILLVVLVILIAVMVIVVLLKMNRS